MDGMESAALLVCIAALFAPVNTMTLQIQSKFAQNLLCGDMLVNQSVLCEQDVVTFSMESSQVGSY